MKKYIVYGGYIISNYDNDRHYIDCSTLCRLYKVKSNECIFVDTRKPYEDKLNGLDLSKYKALFPRYDGNYNLE